MGVRLVVAALEPTWAGLSDRARLLLVSMALQALDKPKGTQREAEYFAGHHPLARQLKGCDDITEADLKNVQRAIAELRKVGALTVLRPGLNGRPPAYRLNLVPHQDQLNLWKTQ